MKNDKIMQEYKFSVPEWECMLRKAKAKFEWAVEERFLSFMQMNNNTDISKIATREQLVHMFKEYLVLIDKTGIAVNMENKETE